MDAATVTAVATAVATTIVAVQLWRAVARAGKRDDRLRRENTIKLYLETLAFRRELREDLPDDRDEVGVTAFVDDLIAASEEEKEDERIAEKRRSLTDYLSYWEAIALGIRQEVLDFETLNLQAGGHVAALAKNYGRWFDHRRNLYGPSIYSGIDELAQRIAAAG